MLWWRLYKLKSRRVETRRRAARALALAPEESALPALSTALGDEDAEVRRHAAEAVGLLEAEERFEPLIRALNDPDSGVLAAALKGLKRARHESLTPALLPLIRHGDPSVSGRAAALLKGLGWKPEDTADEIACLVASGQFEAAAGHGAAAIPALEAVIRNGSYSQRVAAVDALGEISDPRVLHSLLTALKSDDPAQCAAAMEALVHFGDPRAYEAVVPFLRHADGHARAAAAEAAGRLGGTRATEGLLPLLADPAWSVRRSAALALGRLNDPRAAEPLIERLRDGDADVRGAAAQALGSLRDRRAIAPLVRTLTDASSAVQRVAAGALSRVDEKWSLSPEARGAVRDLEAEARNSKSDLRFTLGGLLAGFGITTAGGAPGEISPSGPASLTEQRMKLAVNLLVNSLSDFDPVLRLAAVEALARIGDARVEPDLRPLLGDPDAQVREAASAALAGLADGSDAAAK